MNYDVGERTLQPLPGAEPQAFSRNAIAQLLTLLSKPAADAEDPAMDQPRKNAIWATFLMVAPPGSPVAAQAEVRLRDVWPWLPGWAQDVSEPYAVACSRDGVEPAMYFRWPRAFSTALPLTCNPLVSSYLTMESRLTRPRGTCAGGAGCICTTPSRR